MGFYEFVKDAGKSLFGGEEPDREAAAKIEREVADLGLDGVVKVEVAGDTVKIAGVAPSQEAREKLVLAAGNVLGVARVEEKIAVEETVPGAIFHTVARGESLWSVAVKAYGDGAKYMVLLEANAPMLSDPDKIYPGQVLRIPPLG